MCYTYINFYPEKDIYFLIAFLLQPTAMKVLLYAEFNCITAPTDHNLLCYVTYHLAIEQCYYMPSIHFSFHTCIYIEAQLTQSCAVSDIGSPSSGLPRDDFGGFEDCQRNKEKSAASYSRLATIVFYNPECRTS